MDSLTCYLKPEFLLPVIKKSEEIQNVEEKKDSTTSTDVTPRQNDGQPLTKKQKKAERNGMNKHRPIYKSLEDKLCRSVLDGKEADCTRLDTCKFSHDIQAYLENKPPDIGDECPNFKLKNFCQFGITCRFGKNHLSEDNESLNPSNVERSGRQNLPYDLQVKLRKKTYDFSKSDHILKEVEKTIQKEKLAGSVPDDEQVKIRLEEKKKIDFSNKLVLSPLTTVGNLPFRRICKEYGADITVGEMACVVPIINGSMAEWALTRRHESEDIFGVQICGNNSKLVTYASQLISEQIDADFVDLNIGCPIDLIYQQGGGSALMRRQNVLEQIVRGCSQVLGEKPFTVKTRTGVYADKSVAHDLMPKIENWGASAITLHGRSREQRYCKQANWEYIEQCASNIKRIPVIGNGDILSFDDYQRVKDAAPHVSSVMIGRGALIKPWIFKEIKEQQSIDMSSNERLEMLKKYVNYGLTHWGSDSKGVETTRRFLLEWQSFLHRYVPYGILAHPPQKIWQRPEMTTYLGRDDLETLMSSNKSSDWVKISEMFLGPVPDGFFFVPKHRANAY